MMLVKHFNRKPAGNGSQATDHFLAYSLRDLMWGVIVQRFMCTCERILYASALFFLNRVTGNYFPLVGNRLLSVL